MNIGEPSKHGKGQGRLESAQTRKTVPRPSSGALKRGYWNHQRFCAQARSIEPAMVWGRLYHLHTGFPALEVPEGLTLARGTADPLTDARRQHEIGTPCFGRPTGDWDLIHGELVTFINPQRDLAHRPAGRLLARRTQHVPVGDGGGAMRAHLDSCQNLLDAMPVLRGESRQRRVVTPVSRPLRPFAAESG